MSEIKGRAIKSTVISIAGRGASQVIRLGSNVILTRLLPKEAFGLMGIVGVMIQGLEMMSDLGTRISIISHKRGEERAFLDTAWSIEIMRGALIWIIGLLATIPVAIFYEDDRLKFLIPLATFSSFIGGFASTKIHQLNRNLELKRVVALDIMAQAVGVGAMLIAAAITRSVIALVLASIFTALTRVALSHFWLPGPTNRFGWEPEAKAAMMSFGRWIFVATTISFLSQRLDVLMLAKLLPLGEFGVYNIANGLAQLPWLLGGQVIGTVLLPALSHANRTDLSAMFQTYERAMKNVLPAGGLVCMCVALASPAFFGILYKAEYSAAGWIAQLLMLMAWCNFLQEASAKTLQAMGDGQSLSLALGTKLFVSGSASFLGFQVGGLPGFIIGNSLGSVTGHLVILGRLRKLGLKAGRLDAYYTGVGIALVAVGGSFPYFIAARWGISVIPTSILMLMLIGGPSAWVVIQGLRAELRKKG